MVFFKSRVYTHRRRLLPLNEGWSVTSGDTCSGWVNVSKNVLFQVTIYFSVSVLSRNIFWRLDFLSKIFLFLLGSSLSLVCPSCRFEVLVV